MLVWTLSVINIYKNLATIKKSMGITVTTNKYMDITEL